MRRSLSVHGTTLIQMMSLEDWQSLKAVEKRAD